MSENSSLSVTRWLELHTVITLCIAHTVPSTLQKKTLTTRLIVWDGLAALIVVYSYGSSQEIHIASCILDYLRKSDNGLVY